MFASSRTYLRVVAVLCVVLFSLFVPTILPFANSSNSDPSVDRPTSNTSSLSSTDPAMWLANPSSFQQAFDICLQDDSSRDTLQIDSRTGAYTYTRCSDSRMLNGTGTVTTHGCTVTLQDFGGIVRVLARVDNCVHRGTASIKVTATVDILNVTITDRDLTDDSCDCTMPPPPPPTVPSENLSAGPLRFLSCGENISVLVPLLIKSHGPTNIRTDFALYLVNIMGELDPLAQGGITVVAEHDNCSGSGTQCTGTCADRDIELDWTDSICVTLGLAFGVEAREDCRKKDARYGVKQPASCGVSCGLFFCGSSCGCTVITQVVLGPYTRNQLSRGVSLLFSIDASNSVREFNETDNTSTFLLSQSGCP